MKILVMGGTRFVGKAIVNLLIEKGHDLTLFNRGSGNLPDKVNHIKGDRNSDHDLELLKGKKFDVIVDSSGRKRIDTEKVISYTGNPKHRIIYISSAGVYKDSDYLPLNENSAVDSSSRHFGKYETEVYLKDNHIPFTSFRPTYIYGPGNYNPIEKWFFDRIIFKQPIPIPDNGDIITQLGHVDDLAIAVVKSLDYSSAHNKIYNCSGKKAVTIRGLINSFVKAINLNIDSVDLRSFDSSLLEAKSRKSFPLRLSHFFTDISLIQNDLNWFPKYDLDEGLKDSFAKDYNLKDHGNVDFTNDKNLI